MLGKPLEYFDTAARRIFTDPEYPDGARAQIEWILRGGATPNGIYGVKVFPSHVDRIATEIRWADALPNLEFVHLLRRDLLGQAMSLHRANQTQQWRSTSPVRAEPVYDAAGILNCLQVIVRDRVRWMKFFARTGIEPLQLVYEDVVERPQSAVDAVAGLMNVTPPPRIDEDVLAFSVQRDSLTDSWRARFLQEHADPNSMDVI